MSYTASYNSVTFDPLLDWSETIVPEFGADGKTVTRYRHTITIRGYFHNTSVADKKTDIDTILASLTQSGQTLLIEHDSTNIRTFQASDLLGGGPHVEPSIPDSSNPLKMGNIVPVTVAFTGLTRPSGSTSPIAHTYTDTYAYDIAGAQTFTRRGLVTLGSSDVALTLFDSFDPGKPSAGTQWEYQSKTYDVDDDTEQMTYTYVYRQRHQAPLVSSAANEEYRVTSAIENGLETFTCTGTLTYDVDKEPKASDVGKILSGSSDWPDSLALVRQNVDIDTRNNVLTFTVVGEQGQGGDSDVIEHTETVETTTTQEISDFGASDDGADDFSQVTGKPKVMIVQSGTIVGLNGYPDLPEPVEDGDNVKRETVIVDTMERTGPDGNATRFQRQYTYRMKLLNQVDPGEDAAPSIPTDSPFTGQGPTVDIGA